MSCNYADGLTPYENKGVLGVPEVNTKENIIFLIATVSIRSFGNPTMPLAENNFSYLKKKSRFSTTKKRLTRNAHLLPI